MTITAYDSWETPPAPPPDREQIPSDLDTMKPGPVLSAFLSTIDVDDLAGEDRLVVLRAMERQVSHDQAALLKAMASIVDSVVEEYEINLDPPMGLAGAAEAASAEIRAAMHMTRRAADRELEFAMHIQTRLPRVGAAFSAGDLDRRRVGVLIFETIHLSIAEARKIADRLLPDAPSMTTGRLRAAIRRLCLEADPGDSAARYEAATDERRVVVQASPNGTADLVGLDLPPDRVAEIRDRIEMIARDLRRTGETWTMDQLRADVYLDLLSGTVASAKGTGSRRGTIDLTVDLTTLAGLDDHAGVLNGYGPVIADISRRVAAEHPEAEWRFAVTDGGRTVATGSTSRRPNAGLRRAVELRDRTCIFPGCRMPAVRSDLDHRIPVSEGGETTVEQLAPLCRTDHRLKHAFGWNYRRLPDGDYEWTSPLGRVTVVPASEHPPP